jgi:hypothetical protein
MGRSSRRWWLGFEIDEYLLDNGMPSEDYRYCQPGDQGRVDQACRGGECVMRAGENDAALAADGTGATIAVPLVRP